MADRLEAIARGVGSVTSTAVRASRIWMGQAAAARCAVTGAAPPQAPAL